MAAVSRPKPTRPQRDPAGDAPTSAASAKDGGAAKRTVPAKDAAPKDAVPAKGAASAKTATPAKSAVPAADTASVKRSGRPEDKRPAAGSAGPTSGIESGSGPGRSLPRALFRWYLLLLITALGVVVGGLGSFGHRASATWLGVSWPTGLVLCLGGLVGLLLGLSELLAPIPTDRLWPTRLSAVCCASAGWLLALIWLTYLGPPTTFASKGDVILPNDWKSIAFLLGGMALIVAAAYRAWLASLNARLAQHSGGSGSVHPRG